MKRLIVFVLVIFAALTVLCSCDSILDGDTLSITAHQEPLEKVTDSVIEAGTFDELKDNMLVFISKYEETGEIRAYSYEGIIQEDIDLACSQIMSEEPLGAYAVADIFGIATKIVSYYQIEINITYKVTKEQLNSIFSVSTIRYLKSELLDTLAGYKPSMSVQTKNLDLSEEDALSYVSDIYYENPKDIVLMPVTTVEFFPDSGSERIIVFTFGYTKYETSTLRAMAINLNKTVQNIAETVSGSNDGAILLALAERLMDVTDYDTETEGNYTNQNSAATAYGALVNRLAVGEGYAMAYKALCDELGLECYVVLGKLGEKQHAWNIVELEDHYYHIDVSRCDTDSIASSFLLNDTEMSKSYSWDISRYKTCAGPLTYDSRTDSIMDTSTSNS